MNEPVKVTGKSTRLTVREIADHAGVSRATVSLVLRKSPLVAPQTRERVLESLKSLGYIYNRGAANLRTQRTHAIGVAINDVTNPYFAELTAAIQRAFLAQGRTVFIANSEESPEQQAQFIATMREYNVDGLALCPTQGTSPKALLELKEQGLACVLISRDVPGAGLDFAGQANRAGMQAATEHLISLGHRRIALVGGTDATSTGRERSAGYRKALEAHGIDPDPDLMVPGPLTRSFGASTIKALLASRDPPTAAIGFNDVVAFGIMLGLRQNGREPGRDFAVMGYDDIAEAELWTPALSTIQFDVGAIGTAAAQLLMDRIEHPDRPRRKIVLTPKLMLRDSTCPPG